MLWNNIRLQYYSTVHSNLTFEFHYGFCLQKKTFAKTNHANNYQTRQCNLHIMSLKTGIVFESITHQGPANFKQISSKLNLVDPLVVSA